MLRSNYAIIVTLALAAATNISAALTENKFEEQRS
jgi:hypothetical protein